MTNALTIIPGELATYENTPAGYVLFEQLWNYKPDTRYLLSEWWTLLPYKNNAVIVVIDRLNDPGGDRCILQGVSAVQRVDLLRKIRQLPCSRWIDTVRLILTSDGDDHAAASLLHDFTRLAKKKAFCVESMVAPETAPEFIKRYMRFVAA